ncbi:hypothetical protein [Miniphocaeibacter massiliensis]|uniref:hypothetical protein n=1 Tax=Miniphocaeibacter massiliensis TaxID=2041841 RepID=UPI000C1BB2BF|nr:hypothetical protein [Miniphocaeibacter massiliensis]
MEKKKKVYLIIGVVLILIAIIVAYKCYEKYQFEKNLLRDNYSVDIQIEDFIEVGKGEGKFKEDTFIVTNSEKIDNILLYEIDVLPGKYFAYKNCDYNRVFNKKISGKTLLEFNSANIYVYDIDTKKLVKNIDIMEWLEKYPEYQLMNVYNLFKDRKGDSYVGTGFIEKNDLTSKDEIRDEIFEMYYNLSTEKEIKNDKSVKKEKILTFLMDKKTIEKNEKYENLMYEESDEIWDNFYKKNNFVDDITIDKSFTELKEEKALTFKYIVSDGKLYTYVSAPALPKENKELYTRFPELKKYRDQEWRMVKIVFASKPTPEEVVAMFTDESKQ